MSTVNLKSLIVAVGRMGYLQCQIKYDQTGEKLMSIEEKWITNRIQHDTY